MSEQDSAASRSAVYSMAVSGPRAARTITHASAAPSGSAATNRDTDDTEISPRCSTANVMAVAADATASIVRSRRRRRPPFTRHAASAPIGAVRYKPLHLAQTGHFVWLV